MTGFETSTPASCPRPSRRRCLLALSSLVATGCRSSNRPTPDQGRRVVSLTPNTTETIHAVGAGDTLVGRSRYCDHPPEVTSLPAVGGYVDPSLEAILALRPDLVTGARGPSGRSLFDKLQQRGIACYFPPTESVDEIATMIRGLAERLQVRPRGEDVVRSMRRHLANVAQTVDGKPKPRTLLVFGKSPTIAAGPGSFPDEMLRLAGCRNAVRSGTHYPALGFETILGLDPDLIIDATMAGGRSGAPISKDSPGWSSVHAVQRGDIRIIDDDRVLRPGPRVAEGVALLARLAHPGIAT
ncbi:MAG: ABC transporter substrate-binding protein [Myxococcota bacterium]